MRSIWQSRNIWDLNSRWEYYACILQRGQNEFISVENAFHSCRESCQVLIVPERYFGFSKNTCRYVAGTWLRKEYPTGNYGPSTVSIDVRTDRGVPVP